MSPALKRIIPDVIRVFLLLVLVGIMLYLADPANAVVFQALGIALFLAGGTHLTRRILFHQIELQGVARKAIDENSLPAAVVFAAVIYFLVEVMRIPLMIIK